MRRLFNKRELGRNAAPPPSPLKGEFGRNIEPPNPLKGEFVGILKRGGQ